MKRMARVEESRFLESPEQHIKVVWLRYNPHAFYIGDDKKNVDNRTRQGVLANYLHTLDVNRECGESRYAFRYMYYNRTTADDERPMCVYENDFPALLRPHCYSVNA